MTVLHAPTLTIIENMAICKTCATMPTELHIDISIARIRSMRDMRAWSNFFGVDLFTPPWGHFTPQHHTPPGLPPWNPAG